MQHLHTRVYGHKTFSDGFQSFVLLGVEGSKAKVLQSATLRAGEIDLKAVREGKSETMAPLTFRRTLLERLARAKRFGQKVDCAELKMVLDFLGAGEKTVTKTMKVETVADVAEKKAKKSEQRRAAKAAREIEIARHVARVEKEKFEAAEAQEAAKQAAEHRASTGLKLGSKMETVVTMLTSPKGATSAELLAATGWKAINVKSAALQKLVRILREEKQGAGAKRYFAERTAA